MAALLSGCLGSSAEVRWSRRPGAGIWRSADSEAALVVDDDQVEHHAGEWRLSDGRSSGVARLLTAVADLEVVTIARPSMGRSDLERLEFFLSPLAFPGAAATGQSGGVIRASHSDGFSRFGTMAGARVTSTSPLSRSFNVSSRTTPSSSPSVGIAPARSPRWRDGSACGASRLP